MSSVEFNLTIYDPDLPAHRQLIDALAPLYSWQTPEQLAEAKAKLQQFGLADDLIALFVKAQGLTKTDNSVWLTLTSGSSTSFDAYERIIDFLNQVGIDAYHASLFDSASGGRASWRKPEEYVEFEDAKVYFIGEIDEDERESIEENFESLGAVLAESLQQASLVIVCDNPSGEELKYLQEKQLPNISMDEFWDYTF